MTIQLLLNIGILNTSVSLRRYFALKSGFPTNSPYFWMFKIVFFIYDNRLDTNTQLIMIYFVTKAGYV